MLRKTTQKTVCKQCETKYKTMCKNRYSTFNSVNLQISQTRRTSTASASLIHKWFIRHGPYSESATQHLKLRQYLHGQIFTPLKLNSVFSWAEISETCVHTSSCPLSLNKHFAGEANSVFSLVLSSVIQCNVKNLNMKNSNNV